MEKKRKKVKPRRGCVDKNEKKGGKREEEREEKGPVKEKKQWEIKSPECERPTAHAVIPSGLLAQRVCVCVRACLSEWKSARARNDPVYVFVYVSARLHMRVFVWVRACSSVFARKFMHACLQSVCVCLCVRRDVRCEDESVHSPSPLQRVSLPDLYTGTEISQWGHICDTWGCKDTRRYLVSGWKTGIFELCCL